MNAHEILTKASEALANLSGKVIDVVDIKRPNSLDYALNLSKVVSKLSPLLGNMIEFNTIELLNSYDWQGLGSWERQDPGFPDATFGSATIKPNPGIEIKAWFPFATEITARFKESQKIFMDNPYINVALIAWLPEHIIWGKPKIINALVVSGESVAKARDTHYHRPPSYIVLEPEDTSQRTGNLQQTNTNGYKFQEDKSDIQEACRIVRAWGQEKLSYSPDVMYQAIIKELQSQFTYRLDTNYAKIDRIEHEGIESFKAIVEQTIFEGRTIKEWQKILSGRTSDEELALALNDLLQDKGRADFQGAQSVHTENLRDTSSNVKLYSDWAFESPAVAAEPDVIEGSLYVYYTKGKKTELLNHDLSFILMYAIGPAAREKAEKSAHIALGIKEKSLMPEQEAAYLGVDSVLFHYWKNSEAKIFKLVQSSRLVDAKDVPSGYKIYQAKDAKQYLLLDYDPESPIELSNLDILQIQPKDRHLRYTPFVTTPDSIIKN